MARPSKDSRSPSVAAYLRAVRRNRPATAEEERELGESARDGSHAARDELVVRNMAYVVSQARDYRGMGLSFEDLLSEATIGLIEAADRYDPTRAVRFVTYAGWWIRKRLIEALTDRNHLVRVPSARLRTIRSILDVRRRLTTELGREPGIDELRRASGASRADVDRALLLSRQRSPSTATGEDGEPINVVELLDDPGAHDALEGVLDAEALVVLERELERLDPRQRTVVTMRYGIGGEPPKTLREVGDVLGLSRERVRQLERLARRRLRRGFSFPTPLGRTDPA